MVSFGVINFDHGQFACLLPIPRGFTTNSKPPEQLRQVNESLPSVGSL